MHGGRQTMGKPNAGVCEMEIRRLTGAFKKADQQRHTFDAHFCQGRKHETSKANAAPLSVCKC